MSVSAAQVAAARDLFAGLGELGTRRMMGGLCLYHRGTIFAILAADGGLFLKGAGPMGAELEAAGGTQWSYRQAGRDRPTRMAGVQVAGRRVGGGKFTDFKFDIW